MFAFQAGAKPVLTICALAALLGLAGCSSAHTNSYTAENVAVAPVQAVAQTAAVEVEDDGLPAQTPPSGRIRQMADDPSEPYSRNYGGANPSSVRADESNESARPGKVPDQTPVIPHDLPPSFRRKLVSALAQDE
jgi:hypothetical protein